MKLVPDHNKKTPPVPLISHQLELSTDPSTPYNVAMLVENNELLVFY